MATLDNRTYVHQHSDIRSWYEADDKELQPTETAIQARDLRNDPWLHNYKIYDYDSTAVKVEKFFKNLLSFGLLYLGSLIHDSFYGENQHITPQIDKGLSDLKNLIKTEDGRIRIQFNHPQHGIVELKMSDSSLDKLKDSTLRHLKQDPAKAALFLRSIGQGPSRTLRHRVAEFIKSKYETGEGAFQLNSNQNMSAETNPELDKVFIDTTNKTIVFSMICSATYSPQPSESTNPQSRFYQKYVPEDLGKYQVIATLNFETDTVTYSYRQLETSEMV